MFSSVLNTYLHADAYSGELPCHVHTCRLQARVSTQVHVKIVLGHTLKCKTLLEQDFTCTSCTQWHTRLSLKPISRTVTEIEIDEGK